MSPSHLFRAMQPLRSSLLKSTATTSTTAQAFQATTRSRLTTTVCSRFNSTSATTESSATQQPAPSSATNPPVVPPSLRSYPYTVKTGTVVSVGRMDRTVRVSHRHTTWDPYLRKTYPKITSYLVSDPRNSLREGDVIEFSSGYPKSRHVRHVVERIIAPFGAAIEERPPVMTREERDAERAAKRAAKWERREARRLEEGAGAQIGPKEHVGRIRRLVYERTGGVA
ncbi:hypothetical protein ATEIFO6365_0006055900 [Aspergillus terreus]|uniref:Uncharacterized protein n=1 Tax=Aspergillus terreus TaxID=33178 RepID=A0A5M3YX98_ASPTE|nr:hypothetical protein ATETN484_0005055900 [Aspergillus terreus]GFF17211.1 hypothetical protein ATEIFO6365_0006055900 [Aspergillus terreus]